MQREIRVAEGGIRAGASPQCFIGMERRFRVHDRQPIRRNAMRLALPHQGRQVKAQSGNERQPRRGRLRCYFRHQLVAADGAGSFVFSGRRRFRIGPGVEQAKRRMPVRDRIDGVHRRFSIYPTIAIQAKHLGVRFQAMQRPTSVQFHQECPVRRAAVLYVTHRIEVVPNGDGCGDRGDRLRRMRRRFRIDDVAIGSVAICGMGDACGFAGCRFVQAAGRQSAPHQCQFGKYPVGEGAGHDIARRAQLLG